jgi:hypothetical protein
MKQFALSVCLVFLLLVVIVIPATASPTVSSFSPASAPNNGDVTVTITGTGFNEQSSVRLLPNENENSVYGTVVSWSPTSIAATFPIQGRTPGQYYVEVNSPYTSSVGQYHPTDVGVSNLVFTISQATGTPALPTTIQIPAYGNISVSSIPSGANIYLDNEYRGITPLTIKNVENGDHLVLVRLSGYQDWTQRVAVLGNSPSVSVRLVPLPALTSAPATAATVSTTLPFSPPRTTASLPGIEIGIIATIGAALLIMKRK